MMIEKPNKAGHQASLWRSIPIFLLLMLIMNTAATYYHTRFDLTSEKRFTLSRGTRELLKNIQSPVTIDIFLKGSYPSGFKKLASSTEDLLREFKEYAGPEINYRFLAPEDVVEGTSVTYADTLDAMGIPSINLTAQIKSGQQQQRLFPIALIHYENRILPVEIFKGKTPQLSYKEIIDAEALLEYNLISGIAKIRSDVKPFVAYATGNGEPMDARVYDLAEQTVGPNYNLTLIDLSARPYIDTQFKALIIVKPTVSFSESEKLKIDQYIMKGGKVLFFLDVLNAEMDSLQIKNEVIAYDRDLHLNDLLFKYGVRINPSLIMDLQCDFLPFDVSGNGQFELLPWNYFPVLESANNHPVNKNLGYISGRFVNPIDTVEAENIKKTVILHTSQNSRIIGSPALISGKENITAPENEKYQTLHIPVAVLLEGSFTSLYRNRLTRELNDSLTHYGLAFLPQAKEDNQIMVVSDGDIVMNSVLKGDQPLPMGMNPFTYGTQRSFPFANNDFLINALDYMIDANHLSEAKNKDFIVRLLDKKKLEKDQRFWQFFNILLPALVILVFAFFFIRFRKLKYSVK